MLYTDLGQLLPEDPAFIIIHLERIIKLLKTQWASGKKIGPSEKVWKEK